MSKQVSQEQKIIDYMNRFGGITQLEALRGLGVMRLASRISSLRNRGCDIKSEMITVRNRFGEDCHVARYSLKEGVNHAKQDFGFEQHTV
jgi:hypothetical protein